MNPETSDDDIDEQLTALEARHRELHQRGQERSAIEVSLQIRRLAKAHHRILPYLRATFDYANLGMDALRFRECQGLSIELINLLESEERARLIQPDFPLDGYLATVDSLLLVAYCLLTQHTGRMSGWNSDGLHQCVNDGVEVCRRVGKLASVALFRELASKTYRAADDLDMALHFARLVRSLGDDAEQADRRHPAAVDETWILLLKGDTTAAEAAGRRALALAPSFHQPVTARASTLTLLEVIALVNGRHDAFRQEFGANDRVFLPGEMLEFDHDWDLRDALKATCSGRHEDALGILTPLDRWLREHECLENWFEARLRVIAASLLAGRSREDVRPLADELAAVARPARHWLTLTRLARLLDPAEPVSPLALAGPLAAGPFAGRHRESARPEITSTPEPTAGPPPEPVSGAPAPAAEPRAEATEDSAFLTRVKAIAGRLEHLSNDPAERRWVFDDALDEVLGLDLDEVRQASDAAAVLSLVGHLLNNQAGMRVWRWAERVSLPFPNDPAVLNQLASLGTRLRILDPGLEGRIDAKRLETMFRTSLDLAPDVVDNFARAGLFFRLTGNPGEAERCFARGFRLDRTNSFLALRLSEVYAAADRPRDALAVLNLSIQEGNRTPEVIWEAMTAALDTEQFDDLLLYTDAFEQTEPGKPWTCYYRAVALARLGRPAEVPDVVAEHDRRNPAAPFPGLALRAWAFARLNRTDTFQEAVEAVVALPVREVDYLPYKARYDLLEMLWEAAARLPEDNPGRRRLENYLLATGVAPEAYFEPLREKNPETPDLSLFVCALRQPLDEAWAVAAERLPEQDPDWTEYLTCWGVLAPDEDEAVRVALAWQARCYHLPAEHLSAETDGTLYTDKPGVVWQGRRWSEAEETGPDDFGRRPR